MFYEGKIYRIERASTAIQAMFRNIVSERCAELCNPMKDFLATLDGMDGSDRAAAVSAFVAARRDREYPEEIVTQAKNWLPVATWLVEHLIPDYDGKVTEENKHQFLKTIQLHHGNPELERITEIRDARKWSNEHAA
jgi:hypothetical protein